VLEVDIDEFEDEFRFEFVFEFVVALELEVSVEFEVPVEVGAVVLVVDWPRGVPVSVREFVAAVGVWSDSGKVL